MGQSTKKSIDDFNDVLELEDLSYKCIPEEVLPQYIFLKSGQQGNHF